MLSVDLIKRVLRVNSDEILRLTFFRSEMKFVGSFEYSDAKKEY